MVHGISVGGAGSCRCWCLGVGRLIMWVARHGSNTPGTRPSPCQSLLDEPPAAPSFSMLPPPTLLPPICQPCTALTALCSVTHPSDQSSPPNCSNHPQGGQGQPAAWLPLLRVLQAHKGVRTPPAADQRDAGGWVRGRPRLSHHEALRGACRPKLAHTRVRVRQL